MTTRSGEVQVRATVNLPGLRAGQVATVGKDVVERYEGYIVPVQGAEAREARATAGEGEPTIA